ncbi:uncharacterized protein I206_104469 [Kwoniella pini CBS 10737]|uniref:Uncharacterized protein n=1 Tax=Kwoniella pini CBS 10737 TaxID=1296096 RepID=A0A1B9I6W1_9TREE|nr:uncharacterized protein I206_01999 [Kwoniella pini CBS 10737]OCF51285.1 hypothetical protein I206_01999 [Kwoniella pini CBS 10737]
MPITRKRQADLDDGIDLRSSEETNERPKKYQKGVNHRRLALKVPDGTMPFKFPHCTQTLDSEMLYDDPLPEDHKQLFRGNETDQLIHRRLHRLMAKIPRISIFPYVIRDIKKPGKRSKWSRQVNLKSIQEKFAYTSSWVTRWEKGPQQHARLALFISPNKLSELSHAWAAAIVDVKGGGRYLVIYDCDSSVTDRARGEALVFSHLDQSQKDFIASIRASKKKRHGGLDIQTIYYGGIAKHKNPNMCLENTLSWMESCVDIKNLKRDNLTSDFEYKIVSLTPDAPMRARARAIDAVRSEAENAKQGKVDVTGIDAAEEAEGDHSSATKYASSSYFHPSGDDEG